MGPNFREILPLLLQHGVRFILIGGGAALAHGAARITYDVDLVYARDPENLRGLVAALSPPTLPARRAAGVAVPLGRADDPGRPQLHPDHRAGGSGPAGRSRRRR